MEPQSETLNFANILVLFGDSYLKFLGIGRIRWFRLRDVVGYHAH